MRLAVAWLLASKTCLAVQTGSFLELQSLWTKPAWSQQDGGTVCAPVGLADLLRLQALVGEVAQLLRLAKARWLLSHGSLLGAWLHHGPVPWDEEADILLFAEDFQRLLAVLGAEDWLAQSRRVSTPGSSFQIYEGTPVGALRYDVHEHRDQAGLWLATAVTFRLHSGARDDPVQLDAFLAKANGSHAWTDSAVLPLPLLLPPRRLRFFDWLLPAPQAADSLGRVSRKAPRRVLELWYGPKFAARRKCALRGRSSSPVAEAPSFERDVTLRAVVGNGCLVLF
ncbi:unnamed protein product [Effrenium voratum]|nr:unnamed protein product [Effrenium voratum]